MVHMDSITEETTIDHSINDTNNNASRDHLNDDDLDRRHSADEKKIEFANDTTNNIILYPFAHQVGGHTQLLTLDKSTLCKPLIPRELLFYLNVPKELVKFVPSYKGVVQIRKTGKGDTYPPVVYQPLRSPKSPYAAKYRPGASCTLPAKMGPRRLTSDLCGFPFELNVQIRPCSDEKILRKNLSQDNLLRADYISRPNEKYLLLLENVAAKYQLPCILDLKMGTRQHGDDATEEKRHRQIAKCQASTSASLGVRLCGMQVYQVDYGGFIWYDKYYGRKMNEEGLKRALHEYFRNGSQLNEGIIDDVIQRLKLLSQAVEKSPSFRFYGTSLLIIHEGCTTSRSNTKKCPVDVRLIDFAHTICDYSNTTNGRSSSSPSVLKSTSTEQFSPTTTTANDSQNQPTKCEQLKNDSDDQVISFEQNPMTSKSQLTSLPLVEDKTQLNCAVQIDNLDINSQINRENYQPKSGDNMINNGIIEIDLVKVANSEHKQTINKQQQKQQRDSSDRLRQLHGNQQSNSTTTTSTTTTAAAAVAAALIVAQQKQQQQVVYNIHNQSHEINQPSNKSESTTTPPSLIHDQEIQQTNQQRQIANSNPTTPPSLGSRKISKTSIGPDRGLLFGLENLMRLLDDLKGETLITSC